MPYHSYVPAWKADRNAPECCGKYRNIPHYNAYAAPLSILADSEGIYLEPSALAGMYGPLLVEKDEELKCFGGNKNTTHIVWATGGSMVTKEEMEKYYSIGKDLL